ncbi:hypothetical protein L1N85_10700 [Paenibacillus alkaliterrae]|uniref:hypothetical protein n=1 Tax=Paenibacillus alkaliterrae TaxID=320909 RepID=UPI001F35822B|nr:hypothetical protein [Paenibacillus alkaliterrae]MCF2938905.1 hypothetical protein [Paenibacillus alkaliterrae]
MEEITWTVSNGGSSEPKHKVPYTAKQRVKDSMSESEKQGIERWNAMIDALKENNLMEDK